MGLRIGIDGRLLVATRAGIGRYIYELCRALDNAMPEARFFVYSRSEIAKPVQSERWTYRVDRSVWGAIPKSVAWLKAHCGAMAAKDNLDVFWATGTFAPRLPRNIRLVTTVYDLNHEVVPETMKSDNLFVYRLFFSRDVRRADKVVAMSKGTSDRLLQFVGRRADAVVLGAVDPRFTRPAPSVIAGCLGKYKLDKPYLLAVSTQEPRKNLDLMVRVFTAMKADELLGNRELILVGQSGWKSAALTSLISLSQQFGVRRLGFVPDEDLPSLYAGCDAFVFPSIYEGFGLPALEARSCGATVVATDIPELREAAGPNGVYVRATADGLKEGILAALRTKNSEDVNLPTWDASAAVFAEVLSGCSTQPVTARESVWVVNPASTGDR